MTFARHSQLLPPDFPTTCHSNGLAVGITEWLRPPGPNSCQDHHVHLALCTVASPIFSVFPSSSKEKIYFLFLLSRCYLCLNLTSWLVASFISLLVAQWDPSFPKPLIQSSLFHHYPSSHSPHSLHTLHPLPLSSLLSHLQADLF